MHSDNRNTDSSNSDERSNANHNHTKYTLRWRSIWRFYVRHLLFAVVLQLLCLPATRAFCPSKCHCLGGDGNSQAYCVNAALEDVPIQLNPETKYINLTLNKIRNLEFTLPFYIKLEVLDLSQNIIETIGSKNFEYQSELRTLNLSHNSVSSLQKDAFKGLGNLLLLDLSFNRIEMINMLAMLDLSSLIELDLTNNNIVSLEDNTFRNMISLEILIFRNNQLLDVPSSNLMHLHSLKSLDLSVNLMEFIRNDSFEGLRELMVLTMRGNVISELEWGAFDGLLALKHLDLADNNLTMVPTMQMSRLSNLTFLSLSGNRFTHLPAVAFLNLFHLRELHLNRLDRLQRLDSRAFIDNTHLRSLYLGNNMQLRDIPMRLFQGNPNILEVFMQGNSLQTLYAAQFPVDRLERLYLGENPLQCNCSLLWLWRLVTGNNFSDTLNGRHHVSQEVTTREAVAALSTANETPEEQRSQSSIIPRHLANSQLLPEAVLVSTGSEEHRAGLQLDIDRIGCDIVKDSKRIRRHLAAMSESEITCPAHIVTIVCAVLTCVLVVLTSASLIFYLRFVKRRRKLLHDRSLRMGKSIVNVHDRIMQHQPLSGTGITTATGMSIGGTNDAGCSGGIGMGMGMGMGIGIGIDGLPYPQHTLQSQAPHHGMQTMHHNDYQQTVPQMSKLELERYLASQTIANEYRALKPWELSVKEASYSDEPEHLYEKFDHYEYPDSHTMGKSKQATLSASSGNVVHAQNDSLGKPHVVYV